MKKILLSCAMLLGLYANAQQTLFEDSFESYDDFAIADVGFWTLVDVDLRPTYGFQGIAFANSGVAKSFQVFNTTTTVPVLAPGATSNWTARTGVKNMVCFAAVPQGATINNDWMITPQITLSESGNTLKFWAKSCDGQFGAERFKVGVSTTGTAPADFTIISAGPYIQTAANFTWVEYTFPLDAYANQPVYIGWNCISNDQFGFAVDDVLVTADNLSTENFFSSNFMVYPNPANNVLNIDAKQGMKFSKVELTDLNGRVVKSMNVDGFTTQLNISDIHAGVYFLKVSSNEGVGTSKIIKK